MKLTFNTIRGLQPIDLPDGAFELVIEVNGHRFAIPLGEKDEMMVRAPDARLLIAPVASNTVQLRTDGAPPIQPRLPTPVRRKPSSNRRRRRAANAPPAAPDCGVQWRRV